ncbi:ribonucleotide reductase subunit alpha [Desertibaculum subflavum]|uniref:ribonucleotide reductase subunit alpha n=1 Tax=Desertibaculum subflavum TaxID=2268458 RepID=UPI000E668247
MEISSFDELLAAAKAQAEPQRLLFVFAAAELPGDATPEQRAAFAAGQGGALAPVMYVDKAPAEIADFASLAAEARQFGRDWTIVFAAALAGARGRPPAEPEAEAALNRMVEAVKAGAIAGFIPFDAQGRAVRLG